MQRFMPATMRKGRLYWAFFGAGAVLPLKGACLAEGDRPTRNSNDIVWFAICRTTHDRGAVVTYSPTCSSILAIPFVFKNRSLNHVYGLRAITASLNQRQGLFLGSKKVES